MTTAPAYVEVALTYTGDAQALVTAGDGVIGGTLKYYVSTTESEPATTDEGWTETVSTGTDVGTYYVWYYVDGDANHTSTAVTPIEGGSKAIGKADPTLSATEISFEALGTSTGSKTVTVCDNTGAVSATVTSGATNCRVSVSGTTITITRLTEAAFNATITVTIAESVNYNSATKQISVSGTTASSFPMANAATSDHIGHVICHNGHIHVTVGAASSAGCTASAMIAYVGSLNGDDGMSAYSDSFNHGLAVSLNEINSSGRESSGSSMKWSSVATAVGSYSRARPEQSSPWFLPSMYQWERIMIGCGGTTEFTSLSQGKSFSYGNLCTMMTDCGGYLFQVSRYWSSTDCDATYEWGYYFSKVQIYKLGKTNNNFLRVALAF